jgi:hypothetical protein
VTVTKREWKINWHEMVNGEEGVMTVREKGQERGRKRGQKEN